MPRFSKPQRLLPVAGLASLHERLERISAAVERLGTELRCPRAAQRLLGLASEALAATTTVSAVESYALALFDDRRAHVARTARRAVGLCTTSYEPVDGLD